jgi:sRNA-binding regulator protein Hfq
VSSESTIYTIGTALNRAHDNDMSVQVLVEGQWMSGQVLAVDGHGVVLDSADGEHAVIRMGSVAAVRVCAPPPFHVAIERAARPMPGPREASN